MSELAAQGLGVIMVSSEIPEILGMSDRVIVMREGRIAAAYSTATASTPKRWCAPPPASGRPRDGGEAPQVPRSILLADRHCRAAGR